MRSPWQILKGFASRSKAEDSAENPDDAEDVGGPTTEELLTDEGKRRQNLPELTSSDTGTVSIRVSIASEESVGSAQRERATDNGSRHPLPTEVSSAHQDAPLRQSVEVKALPRADKPTRSKVDGSASNQKHGKKTGQTDKTYNNTALMVLDAHQSDEIAISDQAIALDTEIDALREQLSEKLQAQNAHLRLLIKRYEQ